MILCINIYLKQKTKQLSMQISMKILYIIDIKNIKFLCLNFNFILSNYIRFVLIQKKDEIYEFNNYKLTIIAK